MIIVMKNYQKMYLIFNLLPSYLRPDDVDDNI